MARSRGATFSLSLNIPRPIPMGPDAPDDQDVRNMTCHVMQGEKMKVEFEVWSDELWNADI